MRIDIEEIIHLQKRIDTINDIPFDEIEWYRDGEKVIFSKDVLYEWVYTGLSNFSFINTFPNMDFTNV